MAVSIGLSTASVYPEPPAAAFDLAQSLGYDAVEVMVSIDQVSQDVDAVKHLQDYYQVPVCAVHAPCLLITQRVWGTDPWVKLEMAAQMAHDLGADVVVVHPPFRWQRDYARAFMEGIELLEERTGMAFAVENMYPWRASERRDLQMYAPHWDVRELPAKHTTLDVSHAATSRLDSLELAKDLGERLKHVHLTDSFGSAKDEHLIPGRGNQPVAELLEYLAGERDAQRFDGHVVLEVNTRRALNRESREIDLAEALAFTRLNFATGGI